MANRHQSFFHLGRNSDSSPDKITNGQYVSANNVELTGDSSFQSLRNIKGTTGVQALDANIEVLAVYANKYLISDELVDGLTVFSTSSTTFKIQCYLPSTDTLYDLFSETIAGDYITSDRAIDAVNGPEGGVDYVFFTDFYNEIRKLKCSIPDSYSANFLTSYDLSLLRKGANGTIVLSSVASGGTLLSGTYQFAYRVLNATDKSFTKWSSLTNPIHVYSAENSTSVVNSGIGLITDRKISLTITPSTEETDQYDQIQVAVVENIGPTPAILASVLEIESIPGTSLSYDYKSNSRIGIIPIEDIVVDLAQIEKVKTLQVKDNRLFAGNVHYTSLTLDNGTPAITSGEIITQASSGVDTFSDDEYASKYKGHWRGEVYRYGLVYRDKYGNASSVHVLDLSGVTDNDITVGLADLKFPDRVNGDYTLFNGSGQIQSLGLRLTGLVNHPTWARSVEVVRVNRVGRYKNILFQTPLIPMSSVYGIGAVDNYPNSVVYNTSGDERAEDDATPMTSGYTLVPKNLFWPEQRKIRKVTTASGSGSTRKVMGEAFIDNSNEGYKYSMLFPPSSMYNTNNPFQFSNSESVDFIDYALLKLTATTDSPSKSTTVVNGDDLNTNISGTFYATSDNQYYFNSGHSKGDVALAADHRAITAYEFFDNLGVTGTVAGKAIMDFDALQTGDINLGFKPNIQRSAVVKLDGTTVLDATTNTKTFSAATWNNYAAGGALSTASATLLYENGETNKYINEYSTFSDGNSYVNVVSIVNVERGLGDDRYGDSTDLHEYISTGAKYTFADAEIATLEASGSVSIDLDVWGGDCFVGPHVFKICDSTYSVVNQNKHNGSADTAAVAMSKWNNTLFKDIAEGNSYLSMPVAVESAAQYLQVILESEYNGEVREKDFLIGDGSTIPIMEGEVTTARTPLTYKYNINLNKNNSQKIYVPKPQYSFEQNEFGSRVIYSDLKIYNSDVAGFDIFRVGNFYDIEERFRPITKLALAGNQLYSIHEQGVIYLPTGEQMLEKSDAGTLAVRSGDVIGKHLIIDSERGCQHLRGIVETGNVIYIPDNRNKCVYVLNGQQLQPIIKDNETIFRSMFATKIDAKYLVSVYDPIKGEYWIANADPNASAVHCHIFNERQGVWVSNYSLGKTLRGYGWADQILYLVGANGTATSIYSMYTGDCNQLFDQAVDSDVQSCINPDNGAPKVFDNQGIDSTVALSGVNFEVITPSGTQTATSSAISTDREGRFVVKILRSGTDRLRGLYALATYTFGSTQTRLNSVYTDYRLSARN